MNLNSNFFCVSCKKQFQKREPWYKGEKTGWTICKKCGEELEKERNFEFNKKNVPQQLISILQDIEDNKRKWKSFYMATYGLILYHLEPKYIQKGKENEVYPWGLPGARRKFVLYTPNELKGYLKNSEGEIYVSQLVRIFILLERYFFEYYRLTEKQTKKTLMEKVMGFILSFPILERCCKKKKIKDFDPTYFKALKKYLKKKGLTSDTALLELELAKETRNCLVHKGIIDKRWLKIYKKTGGQKKCKEGSDVPLDFHDLEDWSDMLVKIVENSMNIFNTTP